MSKTTPLNRLCVFCGSSPGKKTEYAAAAVALGRLLAQRNLELVYGGASIGVMGQLANAVLDNGGRVTGVIPRALYEKEVAHNGLPDLRIVDSMHERKALMAELSDGFIALPGGLGTMEELVEVLTWLQLGIHQKPCGLLDICGYYQPFLAFIHHMVEEQFLAAVHLRMICVDKDPALLLAQFEDFTGPTSDKAAWALGLNQT